MKHLIHKITLILPIALLMILVNYFVDPANLFHASNYEYDISEILIRGENVSGISNYDERLLQKHIIKGLRESRDIVVLGSSRSMQVGKESFTGQTVMNNTVSGGTLEDILAIYELYRERKLLPKTIVLGLDPWILNKNHGDIRWKTLQDQYSSIAIYLGLITDKTKIEPVFDELAIKKYLELASPSYFQNSIKMFKKKLKRKRFIATQKAEGELNIKRSDGSLCYARKKREKTLDEINADAIKFASKKTVYNLGDFHELDQDYMTSLESFLNEYKGRVIFFLPPFHPLTYNILKKPEKLPIIDHVETYFRELAAHHNIQVVGSYNPDLVAFSEADFYDAMHPKREAVNRIISHFSDTRDDLTIEE